MGGVAILDDTEDAYIREFGERIGINNDELILLSSLTVEEHFEKVFLGWKDSKGKAKKSLVDLIVENDPDCPIVVALDSVALLSTRHEQEVKFEKPDMAKAKQIRAGMRMVSGNLQRHNILHLISNHVIAKIGVLFGNPKTTPGGSGIPFQASARIELSLGKKIKDKENEEKKVGIQSNVYIAKNKMSAPFKEATIDIYFDRGVDPYSGIQQAMVDDGVLKEEEGNKFVYTAPDGKKETIRGFKFQEWLQEHLDLLV
jgi:recombination protein RecA